MILIMLSIELLKASMGEDNMGTNAFENLKLAVMNLNRKYGLNEQTSCQFALEKISDGYVVVLVANDDFGDFIKRVTTMPTAPDKCLKQLERLVFEEDAFDLFVDGICQFLENLHDRRKEYEYVLRIV